MDNKQETKVVEKVKEETERMIKSITDDGVRPDNVDLLYKLVDIHKDMANEEYWKEKIEMRYGNYSEGSYSRRGVKGTGRGRYHEGAYNEGGYGRYRGEEMMDKMYEEYQEYSEGSYNYGADQETLKSLEKMLESVKKFMQHLKKEASSKEEVEMIKETAKEISMM